MRVMAAHVARGALHVAGLGHDFEVGLAVEQHAQATADDRMIVREHDPDQLGRPRLRLLCGILRTHAI